MCRGDMRLLSAVSPRGSHQYISASSLVTSLSVVSFGHLESIIHQWSRYRFSDGCSYDKSKRIRDLTSYSSTLLVRQHVSGRMLVVSGLSETFTETQSIGWS